MYLLGVVSPNKAVHEREERERAQLYAGYEKTCEESGLVVEWAGELMERQWGLTSKGGIRPVNGPFRHTAFLLIAQRR